MALKPPWEHTSREAPCPVCGRNKRGNRCFFIPNKVVLCFYVESSRRRRTNAGDAWVHFLHAGWRSPERPLAGSVRASQNVKRNDLHLLAQKFKSGCAPARLQRLARDLGISSNSLEAFDVGWCDGEPMLNARGRVINVFAWSFPMFDAQRHVTGLRMRSERPSHDGTIAKFAFTGGGDGLFIPRDFKSRSRAYLCEGATDTPAARDIGLNAFGRSNNSAGRQLILDFLRRHRPTELVLFAQRDEPHERVKGRPDLGHWYPSQDGAEAIVAECLQLVPIVKVILPPIGIKDVRIWRQQGATAADVEQLVRTAPARRLRITVQIRNRKGNGVCHTKQI